MIAGFTTGITREEPEDVGRNSGQHAIYRLQYVENPGAFLSLEMENALMQA
jgi:hypothetical protein